MILQVFDLKDRSPAWAKAFFLKRIFTLRAGATLFPCAWHQRLSSSRGDSPARLIKFSRAFFFMFEVACQSLSLVLRLSYYTGSG